MATNKHEIAGNLQSESNREMFERAYRQFFVPAEQIAPRTPYPGQPTQPPAMEVVPSFITYSMSEDIVF